MPLDVDSATRIICRSVVNAVQYTHVRESSAKKDFSTHRLKIDLP